MRMWLVDPKIMCRNHLMGEHVELHMFVGTINKGIKLNGYVKNELVDTAKIQQRHDDLVKEISARGYTHRSELLYEDKLGLGSIDVKKSLQLLIDRCPECKKRYEDSLK